VAAEAKVARHKDRALETEEVGLARLGIHQEVAVPITPHLSESNRRDEKSIYLFRVGQVQCVSFPRSVRVKVEKSGFRAS